MVHRPEGRPFPRLWRLDRVGPVVRPDNPDMASVGTRLGMIPAVDVVIQLDGLTLGQSLGPDGIAPGDAFLGAVWAVDSLNRVCDYGFPLLFPSFGRVLAELLGFCHTPV